MTTYIVAATCILSIIDLQSKPVFDKLIFNPYTVQYKDDWYRLFTSGLIHANWPHLFINMFVLYSFGSTVEEYYKFFFGALGTYYFLLLYIGGIVVSILPTYYKQRENPDYNALWASGAVSSVLFTFILFKPLQPICLYGVFCLPGIVMGLAYLGYEFYMDKKGKDNINHGAHFWGAVFGVALTIFLKPSIAEYFMEQVMNGLPFGN